MFPGNVAAGFARNVSNTYYTGNFSPWGRLYYQYPQNVISGFSSFGGVNAPDVSLQVFCTRILTLLGLTASCSLPNVWKWDWVWQGSANLGLVIPGTSYNFICLSLTYHIYSHETLKHNWSQVQFCLVLNLKGLCSEYLALPKNRVEMYIHVQDFTFILSAVYATSSSGGMILIKCYHHDSNSWPVAFQCLVTENVKRPRNFSMWFHRQLKMVVSDSIWFILYYSM